MLVALLATACGKKAPEAAPAAPPPAPSAPAAPAAPEAPEPPPAPEPAEPVALPSNADFSAKLTRGDGSVVSGKVHRVERGHDRYAEKGWSDSAAKLGIELESGTKAEEVTWTDIKTIQIGYLGREAVGCDFDSDFTPVMYTCTMKTKSVATKTDGSAWDVGTRNKWKFEFDSGEIVEFYLFKLPLREQEEGEAEIGDGSEQSTELYQKLQDEVVAMIKTDAVVTKIEISP